MSAISSALDSRAKQNQRARAAGCAGFQEMQRWQLQGQSAPETRTRCCLAALMLVPMTPGSQVLSAANMMITSLQQNATAARMQHPVRMQLRSALPT